MRFIGNFLRIYSYIFEAILCFMAVVFAIFLYLTPQATVNIGWLPWSGDALARWLLILGLIGLACTALAVLGRLRFLLFLFAIAALVILTRGLFMSAWSFHGEDEAKRALYLVLGAFLAVVGSVPLSFGRDSSRGASRSSGMPSGRVRA